MASDLFDGEILRRRPFNYLVPGSTETRSAEVLTGPRGGRMAARVISLPSGEEWRDPQTGIEVFLKYEHPDSPERAEEIALQDLRRRLEANGGRLLPDA